MNKLNENNNLITTVVEETNQNKIRKNNLMAKRIADILRLIPTYLSSILVVVVLAAIIIYVFVTGAPAFSLKLLTDDYKEKITAVTYTGDLTTNFEDPNINGSYFSIKYGIAVADSRDTANEKCMIVTYIADNSPLKNVQIANGEGNYSVSVDDRLDTVMLYDEDGLIEVIGKSKGAEKLVEALDSSTGIMNMQCKTSGGGARGSLITTIYLILLTLIIALPIGVIASIFLTQYARDGIVRTIITTMIDMTSGIPSIIFGFCGALIFIPFCDGTFNTSGYSVLAGAFTMTIVLLPTIIKTVSESLLVIPRHYTMASLALGASKTQTVFKVILPNSIPGILTATLLSIGRIIGESAALIFVMGTSIQDDINVTKASTSLAVHIWSITQGESPNYGGACAIAIFILIVVLVLSVLVKLISKKMNKMAV